MVDLEKILKDDSENIELPEGVQEMLLDRIWNSILEWLSATNQTEEKKE